MDHAPVIRSLDAAHIRRQMRLNSRPLLVTQPEQISAHQYFPQYESKSYCGAQRLMSFDPKSSVFAFPLPPTRLSICLCVAPAADEGFKLPIATDGVF
jgi:hypothetical protein